MVRRGRSQRGLRCTIVSRTFDDITGLLPKLRAEAKALREILLTNLVMVGEIPAPTFGEKERVRFLQSRFSECGLHNCSTDESDNALGILPGKPGSNNILVVAHTDTVFGEAVDHTISLGAGTVHGTGVADNSLGLAGLLTLPTLFERIGIQLQSNLIMMGASRSLGRGNLEGLCFFLLHNTMPIRAGVCVEGVQLGRLSIGSIGMLRGEIRCSIGEQYDWSRFGTTSAILTINEVMNRILEIPVPRRPRTSVVLGTISGGQSFNTIAKNSVLGFEIRSESGGKVREIAEQMEDIVAEVASATDSEVSIDIFASREPGGISFAHPLAKGARQILHALGIERRVAPSTSELSAFIDQQIPAITTGVTTAEHLNEPNETVHIDPMFTGMAQIAGILLAIDGGFCDED